MRKNYMTEQDEAIRQGSMYGEPASVYMADDGKRRFYRNYSEHNERYNRTKERIKKPIHSEYKRAKSAYNEETAKRKERLKNNLVDYSYFSDCISSLEAENNLYIRLLRLVKTKFISDMLRSRQNQLKDVLYRIYEITDSLTDDIKKMDKDFDETKMMVKKDNKSEIKDTIVKPLVTDTYNLFEEIPDGYDTLSKDISCDLRIFIDIYLRKKNNKSEDYMFFLKEKCGAEVGRGMCNECGSRRIIKARYCPICGNRYFRREEL